jgi:hypothetical protein
MDSYSNPLIGKNLTYSPVIIRFRQFRGGDRHQSHFQVVTVT